MNTKYKVIEQVMGNLAVEYVNNNKKCSEYVKECDEAVVSILGMLKDYNQYGIQVLFNKKETLKVYRGKQKGHWNLIKKVRNGELK